MERANKYIMKSFQNSTIGPILKELIHCEIWQVLFKVKFCVQCLYTFIWMLHNRDWYSDMMFSLFFIDHWEKGTWINVHPWSLTCFGKPEDKDRRTQKILTQTQTKTKNYMNMCSPWTQRWWTQREKERLQPQRGSTRTQWNTWNFDTYTSNTNTKIKL